MNTYVVEKDSWDRKISELHIKYAIPYVIPRDTFATERVEGKVKRDYCYYWRSVATYLIKFTGFFTAAALFAIVNTVTWLGLYVPPASSLVLSVIFAAFTMMGFVLAVTAVATAIIFAVYFAAVKIKERWPRKKGLEEKAPGFFKMKYKSWKEKYCPAIEFEE